MSKIKQIDELYESITFYDQYFVSIILFISITILCIFIIIYSMIKSNMKQIQTNWIQYRCHPYIMPFAGWIQKTTPEQTSWEATNENFQYCTQNIISSSTGEMLVPITFITSIMQTMISEFSQSIQNIRGMFNNIRTSIQNTSEDIMNRSLNSTIGLQEIIIGIKDFLSKIQGILTGGLFTMLASYDTLKSLLGAIAQFIIIILIALASMIAAFWAIPMTWGAAIANTTIFLAIAIPMAVILGFMSDSLHIHGYSIPKLKCFHPNVKLLMNNNDQKKCDMIKVGDILFKNNIVIAKIYVCRYGSTLIQIENTIVSDSHKMFTKNGQLIFSKDDKNANIWDNNNYRGTNLNDLNNEQLICFVTNNGQIWSEDNICFCDWFDNMLPINNLIVGFATYCKIAMWNNIYKTAENIVIGDRFNDGSIIYGIVEMKLNSLQHMNQYWLHKSNTFIDGYFPCIHNFNINISIIHTNINCKNTLIYFLTNTGWIGIDYLPDYDKYTTTYK